MSFKSIHRTLLLGILPGLLILASCKKEQEPLILSAQNQWILDSMRVYYYWNEQLPRSPADMGNPADFFSSLLNGADRFSFMVNPSVTKSDYSSFAWYGLEYALLDNPYMGVVTLVVPGGPADQAGLQRGDFFTAVNGTPVNASTMTSVSETFRRGDGIRLDRAIMQDGVPLPHDQIQVTHRPFAEQPVYIVKTFEAAGKKVGYIFYNQFNGNYDRQVLQAIGSFRGQGIKDIILDLRYNPGGDVSTAAKIAAALSGADAGDTFVIYQANKNGGRRVSSFQKTMNENHYQPQSFAEIGQYRLDVDRVMVLATASTASAAELLAHALKPYTEVVLIGAPTMGKDMASFTIDDQRSPKSVNLVLHPLVFKLYDAMGKGDYSDGLKPDHAVDEFSVLPLRSFGDETDPLIAKALQLAGHTSGISNKTGLAQPMQNRTVSYQGREAMPVITGTDSWPYRETQ